MFTSRAEYRLILRADNADQRLTEHGYQAGCVGEARWTGYIAKHEALSRGVKALSNKMLHQKDLPTSGRSCRKGDKVWPADEVLGFSHITISDMEDLVPEFAALDSQTKQQLKRDCTYHPYVRRQQQEIARLHASQGVLVPEGFQFDTVKGLSSEVRAKLAQSFPKNLREISEIEGITPVALIPFCLLLRKPNAAMARRYSPMIADVSRETMDKLQVYAAELRKWNQRINLVARGTVAEIWDRHILDSLSIVRHDHTPEEPWMDIGSGAGLPGLVLAIMRSEIASSGPVTLVDKDQRKCAFLRQIAFTLGLNVTVKPTLLPSKHLPQFRYLSARALAPLDKLLYLTHQNLTHDGRAFFMKGAGLAQENCSSKAGLEF